MGLKSFVDQGFFLMCSGNHYGGKYVNGQKISEQKS